jgi:hypothetical protein
LESTGEDFLGNHVFHAFLDPALGQAVIDGRDIYEEILGTGAAEGPQTPKRRRVRRKKES